jgi:hypothetical protein
MPRLTSCALSTFIIAGLLISGSSRALAARKPSTKITTQNDDQIEVIAHVAFDGTGVTQVTTGEHWRKNYLYLNSADKITVVDVTNGGRPNITSEYRHSLPAAQAQVQVVVGNAVLLADAQPATQVPSSISIMSFANPADPKMVRQFTKVTGFLIDSRRGLIYVVNNEGLWILSENPGRDLELEKQYEHELMYNR